MTTQTQTPEERLSKLEGAYGQVNERFNDLAQAVREGDAALREAIREGDAALRSEMNERLRDLTQGQAALGEQIRQVDANLRASQEAFRSETHAAFQRQTYLIIGSLGAMWASMVGGFIALFLSM